MLWARRTVSGPVEPPTPHGNGKVPQFSPSVQWEQSGLAAWDLAKPNRGKGQLRGPASSSLHTVSRAQVWILESSWFGCAPHTERQDSLQDMWAGLHDLEGEANEVLNPGLPGARVPTPPEATAPW